MKKAVEQTATDPMGVGEAATPVESGDAGASPRNPWWFVPSLYFMQGLPVVVVQMMSVTMYKKMGVSNAEIGLWTSLIAWPWIAKMLWGPLVENNGTRRGWIIAMQALMIAGLGLAAFSMGLPSFFGISLAILFIIAFLSATHDIAADGYYLLALKEGHQSAFVGIRSAFFRLAMIFGTGILVVLAGQYEKQKLPDGIEGVPKETWQPLIAQSWVLALAIGTGVYAVLWLYGLWALPKPANDKVQKSPEVAKVLVSFVQIVLMMVAVFLLGRLVVIGAGVVNNVLPNPIFTKSVELTPLFVQSYEGHAQAVLDSRTAEKIAEAAAKGTPLTNEDAVKAASEMPSAFLIPDLVLPFAVQLALAVGLIALAAWSTRRLFDSIGMAPAAKEYFTRDKIFAILGFILFYRFGESMLGKMSSPFLIDAPEKGGLGVNTQAVGVIIGTVGIIGLTLGGLLGGLAIYKWGIKKSIWPMVLCLNIPNLFYIWLAMKKPESPLSVKIEEDTLPFMHWALVDPASSLLNLVIDKIVNIPSQIYNLGLLLWEAIRDPVGQVIVIDQFGYGFGFSAYMVYLMFIAQGTKHQTSNYAISTGLMALGAMIAGITSGYLQQFCAANYGGPQSYMAFFIGVVICTIPGMIMLFFIPMDKQDIKTRQIDID